MSEAQASVTVGLRERHEALRDLLERIGVLLELLAEIQLDLRLFAPADPVVRARTLQLLEATLLQSQTLNILSDGRHRKLYDVYDGIETEIRGVLAEGQARLRSDPVVLPLSACRTEEQARVGGKAARLGEHVLVEHFGLTGAAHLKRVVDSHVHVAAVDEARNQAPFALKATHAKVMQFHATQLGGHLDVPGDSWRRPGAGFRRSSLGRIGAALLPAQGLQPLV